MKLETKSLFKIIETAEQIRDLFRLTAPDHNFDEKQNEIFKKYLAKIKKELKVLGGLTNGSKN